MERNLKVGEQVGSDTTDSREIPASGAARVCGALLDHGHKEIRKLRLLHRADMSDSMMPKTLPSVSLQ